MKKLFLAWLIFSGVAIAAGGRYDGFVINSSGRPVPTASIRVCASNGTGIPCSPAASIYSDIGLTIPLAQGFHPDSNGNFYFYAPAGFRYVVQISGTGITTYTMVDQLIPDPGTFPVLPNARVAFSNGTTLTSDSSFTFDNSNKNLTAPAINFVTQAYAQSGANAGAKINNCIANLPSTGGVCDARGLTGSQVISSAITVGTTNKPVLLMLGSATFSASATITVGPRSSILGVCGGGNPDQTYGGSPSIIYMSDSANLSSQITMSGASSDIACISVNGNKGNNVSAGDAITVPGYRVTINHVSVLNSNGRGLYAYAASNAAAAGNVVDSYFEGADGAGVEVDRTADWSFNNTFIENNEGTGLFLNSAPGTRFIGGDVGGNGHNGGGTPANGIVLTSKNGALYNGNGTIIYGTQLGNSYGYEIYNDGWDGSVGNFVCAQHQIFVYLRGSSHNTSPGPPFYDGIKLVDTYANYVSAVVFAQDSGHPYKYAMSVTETSASRAYPNKLVGVIGGVAGTGSIEDTTVRKSTRDFVDLIGGGTNYVQELFPIVTMLNSHWFSGMDTSGSIYPILGPGGEDYVYLFGQATQKRIRLYPAGLGGATTGMVELNGTTGIAAVTGSLTATGAIAATTFVSTDAQFISQGNTGISGTLDMGAITHLYISGGIIYNFD